MRPIGGARYRPKAQTLTIFKKSPNLDKNLKISGKEGLMILYQTPAFRKKILKTFRVIEVLVFFRGQNDGNSLKSPKNPTA
jgi:hypothetical protein